MKLEPVAGYVLIEPIEEEEITSGGFVVPESAKDRPSKGVVLDNTPTKNDKPLKNGQKVVFRRYAGQAIREDNKDLRLVKFEDVIGIYG
jgi:chaperonin GroES